MALLVHLRADSLIGTYVNNDPVALWPDLSAYGNDAEQSDPANRPVFKENIQNGLPAVYFTGGLFEAPRLVLPQDALQPPFVDSYLGIEGFIVLKRDPSNYLDFEHGGPWEVGSGNIGSDYNAHYPIGTTGPFVDDPNIVDTFGANSQRDAGDPGIDLATTHIYNPSSRSGPPGDFPNGSWIPRFNGVQGTEITPSAYGVPHSALSNNAFQIGSSRPDGFGGFKGWIMEVRIYGGILTCPDRYDVNSELRDYWELEGVTPEDCEGTQRGGVTRFTHLIRGGTMRTSVGMGGQPKGRYKAWKPLTVRKPYPTLPINPPSEPPVGGGIQTHALTESTTIAAAAFTDTTIQMPAGVIVLAVSVLVTTAIPGPTTHFSVGDAADVNRFQTANVPVALGSSDPGTKAGAYYNATATAVRLSMVGGSPATNVGRVRVTINYMTVSG